MVDNLLDGVFGASQARPIDDLFGPSSQPAPVTTGFKTNPAYESDTATRARAIPTVAPDAAPLDKVDVDIARRDQARDSTRIDKAVGADTQALAPPAAKAAGESSLFDSIFGNSPGQADGDTWAQTGSKILSSIIPTIKKQAGGIAEFIVSNPIGASDGFVPPEMAEAQQQAQAWADEAKRKGSLPGQKMVAAADADLQANALNPGDSTVKKYAGLLAEGVINMVPAIAASAVAGPAGGAAVFGAQSFGDQYADSTTKGRSSAAATVDSVFAGAASALAAELPLRYIMRPGGAFLASTMRAAGAGAAGNVLGTVLQDGYNAGVLKEDMTWGEAVQQVRDAGITGALVGGVAHAALHPFTGAQQPGQDIGGTRQPGEPTSPDARALNPDEYHIDERTGQPRTFATARQAGVYATSNQMGDRFNVEAVADGQFVLRKAVQPTDDQVLTPQDKASPIPDATIAAGRKQAAAQLDPNAAAATVDAHAADQLASRAPSPEEAIAALQAKRDAPLGQAEPDVTSFVARAGAVESGNRATATNPNSSATGTHQFVASTWLSVFKGARPKQAAGLSDDQILALRNNPLVSAQMAAAYARQNGAALAKAGLPVNDGTLYLSHFLGAGGAHAVLTADPNTPVEQLLSPGQVRANQSVLAGKTAAQVTAWAYQKMHAQPTPAANVPPAGHADSGTYTQEGVNDFISRVLGDDETGEGGGAQLEQAADDVTDDGTPLDVPSLRTPAAEDAETGQRVSGPFEFLHGSPRSDLSLADITTDPRDTKQGAGKKSRYGGFYVSDLADAAHAEGYARMGGQGDGAVYRVALKPDANVEELARGSDITRFNAERIASFRARGVDAVRGRDPRGRMETVVINRDAIQTFQNRAESEVNLAESKGAVQTANPARPVQTSPVKQRSGPVDVITFLADHGGIRDDEGHNLGRGGRDLQRVLVPGAGAFLRKKGMSLDEAGELLHEAGYAVGQRPSTADVLDIIEKGINQKVYRADDTGDVMDREAARQNSEDADRFRDTFDPIAKDYGEKLTDDDVLSMQSRVERGATPHEAFVSHFEDEHASALADSQREVNDDRYEDPKPQESDPNDARSQEAALSESRSRGEASDDAPRDEGTVGASEPDSAAGPRQEVAAAPVTIDDRPGGKSILIRGVPQSDEARIRAPLPDAARPLWNEREQGWVVSAKHRAKLETALAAPATEQGLKVSDTLSSGMRVEDAARAAREAVARHAVPTTEPEEQVPAELRSPAPQPEQADAFGTRPGDQRAALERAGEGRSRSDVRQKAPGSDGGLFDDNTSKVDDLFGAKPEQAAKPKGYGDENKLVSKSRAEEIRAKLREKMRQLNSGVDPEALALFTELGVFHLEAGVRKFRDFARALTTDAGVAIEKVRPFLRSAYNGARDLMEDSGHSVVGMETPEEVATAMRQFDTWAKDSTPNRSEPQTVGDLPKSGVAPANVGTDGKVYVGRQGGSHFEVAEKYGDVEFNGDTGFVDPEGNYLNREQALAYVNRNGEDIRPSSNMASELDAMDYREQRRPPARDLRGKLEQSFADAFQRGDRFATITEARALAARKTGESFGAGTPAAKTLDEAIEAAVVRTARSIAAANESDPRAAYDKLVDLYQRQPKLGVRTSTSVEQQAYSTPVPLAYIASRRAGITHDSTVYEPSAGNGALLIDARATYVQANELNADRAAALRSLYPGADVTTGDATKFVPQDKVDAVIANPPFGPIKGDDGKSVTFDMGGGYRTNEIDHAIALRSLQAMKDGGKAVLIIGSVAKTAQSDAARSDAYNGKVKREFFFKLYGQYNVTDHFTVAGELYERQGAGWPVDVVVIDGRGKSALPLPAARPPRVYSSWDALAETLNERGNPSPVAVGDEDRSDSGERSRPARGDAGNRTGSGERRPDRRDGIGADDQPDGVRPRPASGQPGSAGVGEREAGRDPAVADQGQGRPARRAKPEVAENARQVAYAPGSAAPAMGTLVPVNMQTSIRDALDGLRERVGDIDSYVGDKLGMTKAELAKGFGGEQVDAVALAIDNIERGAGLINGDQTGIGKGRVAAAVLRYAIKQGLTPIFVTEKPNLYKDMYRDMADIGVPEMLGRAPKILMTDAAKTVPLDDDGKEALRSPAAAQHNATLERVAGDGLKSSGFDVAFTTYSQMQAIGGEETARQRALRQMANGAIVVLDESHNAGGQGPQRGGDKKVDAGKVAGMSRAEFVRDIVQSARGVLYSSATYAKRPDVMDLYAATDMKLAVDDISKLGDAIAKGGVPMQQIVASMLGRAGQYVRRERSFDGVNYNTPRVKVNRAQYEAASSILKAIQLFSEDYVSKAAGDLDEELKGEAQGVGRDTSTGGAGASSTNFTAIMHNVIDQMLLAFKVEETADRAIAAIKAGEKPVVTVANTLESLLTGYAEEDGIKVGDPIDITFADVFRRYLERSRWVSIRKPFMEKGEKAERKRLTDAQLGPAGAAAFKQAMAMIDKAGLENLPGSPIDAIISRVQDAGYKVGEITGRGLGISYRGGKAYLKSRGAADKSIAGRISAIGKFNDGTTDMMLLNQAGSTGVSLHASERFKDQRKRRMIIAQPERNIDTHMQMLGRVKRTGEVVLPEYDQLVADIPAEKRPAAVLAKKMASLNANTTASRDSAVTAKDVPDFMNLYGDEVAARVMAEEPDLHDDLGSPLNEGEEGEYVRDGAMRKVTGRIPLLPLAQQEELYDRLEGEYDSYLANKEAAGENALEAKTLPLDAQTKDSVEVVPAGANTSSPFAAPVNVETVSVKRLGKPHSTETVQGMVKEGRASLPDVSEARNAGQAFMRSEVAKTKEGGDKLGKRLADNFQRWDALARGPMQVGQGIRLKTDNGNLYGVVTKIEKTGRPKNPIALGSWKATVALVDASRQMTIPFSMLDVDRGGVPDDGRIAIGKADRIGDFPIMEAFDRMQTDSREQRHIITGNILAGFDFMKARGSIINFTDDKGQVRQGILAPRNWTLEKQQKENGVPLTDARAIVDFLSMSKDGSIIGKGKSGDVSVALYPTRHELIVTAAKSKRAGGEFFLNRDLTNALQTDFVSSSGGMVARARADLAGPVLQALMRAGVRFGVPGSAKDEVKERAKEAMQRYGARYSIDGTAAAPRGGEVAPVDLQGQLAKLGIQDRVLLNAVAKLGGDRVRGQFSTQDGQRIISIATDGGARGAAAALDHEAIHAMRDMGLFRSAEWTAMKNAAQADRELMRSVGERYEGLNDEQKAEEAVADMFARWQDGRRYAGFVQSAFQRIRDMLAAVRRLFTGSRTARDVMRDVAAGRVGDRESSAERTDWNIPAIDSQESTNAVDVGLRNSVGSLIGNGTAIGERIDAWRTNLQDRMLPLLRTQQRIELETGRALPEAANPYLAEELMSGKVGSRLEKLNAELVEPLFDAMEAEKLSVDEVETYLYARHAPERNERISEINPAFEEGTGSGMSDAEATAIMERVAVEGKKDALDRIAARVDKILAFAVDTRVESGLLSQDEADAWRSTYEHYVPLRGEAEPDPTQPDRPRRGSGINIRGRESQMAFGRKSRASNILAYSLLQAEEAIVRAGTNEVGQAFHRMAKANPDPDFWTIDKVSRKPTFNKKTGQVAYRPVSQITAEDRDYTVSLKIDGEEHRVTLNRKNPAAKRLAKAMRNLDAPGLGAFIGLMSKVNGWLSKVNTMLVPEFVITNALRDVQTAGFNALEIKGLTSRILRDYRKALVGATKGAFGKGDTEWTRAYREYVDAGGAVYFNRIDDLNDIASRIEKEFSERAVRQRGGARTPGEFALVARQDLRKLFDFIEKANLGVESAVRLSAFKNARELGKSAAEAASFAKNLTVNFNRRGQWGPYLNAFYLFYNAGVQGTARLVTAATVPGRRGNVIRAAFASAVAMGAISEALNRMLSDDDDDGQSFYDKVPDFDKSRNLILMLPGQKGRYLKWPLPYGYNVFYALGRAPVEMIHGRKWQDSVADLGSTTLDAFNPIGGANSLLNMLAPTIIDPVVDLERNRDYADRPIMPDQSQFGAKVPDHLRYWSSVNPNFKAVTDFLARSSGGDDVLPGAIDISPQTLQYLNGVVTGSAGSFFVDRVGGTISKVIQGDEVEPNDVPFVRKLVGGKPSWMDKSTYYSRLQTIDQARADEKSYHDNDDSDGEAAFRDKNDDVLSLESAAKSARKQMKTIKRDKVDLEAQRDRGEITRTDYQAQRKEIDDREQEVVSDFNGRWNEVLKP